MSKQKRSAEPVGGRIRYSISRRLNRRLFFRLLSLFFTINVIICVIAAICIAAYCESAIYDAEKKLAHNSDAVFDDSKYKIRIVKDTPQEDQSNFDVTVSLDRGWPLSAIYPERRESILRGLRAEGSDFRSTASSLTYIAYMTVNGAVYELSMNIGGFALYFAYAFAALCAFEFLSLISRSLRDRKLVRKSLDPISEFARAAQSLNEVTRSLEHDKAMAIAGKLDDIDANRLDTRIQIDDLQEELKNVAIAINGMLDRINESYAAQARFVSDASHELRTPIAVIQGYANMLDRWGKGDEKTLSESISAIKDEANNMKGLVEQLLFLARGDSNTIQLREEKISVSDLVFEVVSEMKMLELDREFITKADDIILKADRSLIKQALRALIDNAVKYTDSGGRIKVTASADGEYVRMTVSDDGVGISADILPHIFTRFVRADESRNRSTGGAGLGLSITHWIVKRHDGHMETISREGIGTHMTMAFPIIRQETLNP